MASGGTTSWASRSGITNRRRALALAFLLPTICLLLVGWAVSHAQAGDPPAVLAQPPLETDLTTSAAGEGTADFVGTTAPLAGAGEPVFSVAWTSAEAAGFDYSVAWGDYDGDGDLDLAVGNSGRPNRLYRNDSGALTPSAVWSSTESDPTHSVAWGDYDGDGDLDLAAGNYGQPNRLYRNDGGTLTRSAVWSSTEADYTSSIAWGDYDGDGDLDLAVGNGITGLVQPNRLYRNDGGTLTASAVWSSAEADITSSVAWGDYDGDGDLDLAVGCYGSPNLLYRNDSGVLTANAVWSSTESDWTQSMAWEDYDGDGDLDLAAGNGGSSGQPGQPNRLYRNDGGVLTSSAVWSSTESDDSESIAWGDYDGDGDLDLAAGNYGQPIRLYRNDGGTLTRSAVWSSADRSLHEKRDLGGLRWRWRPRPGRRQLCGAEPAVPQ